MQYEHYTATSQAKVSYQHADQYLFLPDKEMIALRNSNNSLTGNLQTENGLNTVNRIDGAGTLSENRL